MESMQELAHGRSCGRFSGQRPGDQCIEGCGNRRIVGAGGNQHLIAFVRQYSCGISGHQLYVHLKGKLTGEHFIEHDTSAVDVRASITLHPEPLLWGHVVQGADDLTGAGGVEPILIVIVEQFGDPEVQHLDDFPLLLFVEEDVGGLTVRVQFPVEKARLGVKGGTVWGTPKS